ncbi:hypothetical protein FIV42_07170 [Persicimonas caeni]|uniref:Uncharacterized protein n=1 Tax=Persicimonas caeni TaxID=2292766 RepID=A0A4Y6PQJ6_PERCE|nr:hypothetical protein [Persicimonas caeni]QDG50520.1 hypothetical protein FIV42_07170 [Persicimonas caeni]QED31741.1 hypothetical protein FRD00_07165 [Persicimonas caeni]
MNERSQSCRIASCRIAPALVLVAFTALCALVLGSGCEEYCAGTERSYNRALAAERTEVVEPEALSGDSPAQFGLALKTELIGDILDIVLQPTIDGALTAVSAINVDGDQVRLRSEGQILDLDVASDSACDHCFRITANLDGAIHADIPDWGNETANLGGSMSLVVPLLLERGETSDAALKLDLPAFVDIGRSSISARLGGVSDEVADMLEAPLSNLLLELLKDQLAPVTVAEFDAPSFGIPGFKLLPVQLVTDDASGTVFAGFATNIEALDVPGAAGVEPITDLAESENLAIAFQPAIIGHSLSLLMNDGQVARTYDLSGNASSRGNAHVTLDGFEVGEHLLDPPDAEADAGYGDGADAGYGADVMTLSADAGSSEFPDAQAPDVPFALGFQVFNLSSRDGFCFGFGAQAVGGVSVRDSNLEIDLVDVRFTDSFYRDSLVNLSNWMDADFVTQSRTLVSQSLDKATVTVPGTELSLGATGLELRPNAVVLRAQSAPQ